MMVLLILASLTLQQTATMQTIPARDTAVVVQGLLVRTPPASGGAWLMALPTPLGFREFSVGELELVGDTARWAGFNGHYVEARGKLAATLTSGSRRRGVLQINSVKEVDPPGTVRNTVSESWAHRVAVVLWVLPQQVSWRTETGQPTGIGPAIVYTLNNHSESEVSMLFGTKEFVCFSVEPKDGDRKST